MYIDKMIEYLVLRDILDPYSPVASFLDENTCTIRYKIRERANEIIKEILESYAIKSNSKE